MSNIRIERMDVFSDQIKYVVDTSSDLDKYFLTKELIIKYPFDVSNIGDGILIIPLVSNLCTFAWITGSTFEVDILDSRFASSLKDVKEGYKETYEEAGLNVPMNGQVVAETTMDSRTPEFESSQSAMLFTGGVDSTATYCQKLNKNPNLVSFSLDWNSNTEWTYRQEYISRFADYFGTDAHFIETNLEGGFLNHKTLSREYHNALEKRGWIGAVQYPIGYMGVCAPLCSQYGYTVLYQSSGYTQDEDFPESNPKTVGRLSWNTTKCELSDSDLTRQEKMRLVLEKLGGSGLEILSCTKGSDGGNCSNCTKCYRNILAIACFGGNPNNYGYDFQHEDYRELRSRLETNDILLTEVDVWFLSDIQDDLNVDEFNGPVGFAEWFVKFDLQSNKENLKTRMWRRIPYPFDLWTLKLYQRISSR